MNSVPRILYVASHWPGAATYGAQQRVLHIGRLLQQVGHVGLAVVNCSAEAAQWRRQTEREFEMARVINAQPLRARGLCQRIRHELDVRYLATMPLGVSTDERQAMLDLARQYDIVWVHNIRTANVLGIYHWPRSVIDIDDLPSRLYRTSALSTGNFIRRLLDLRMSVLWRRREARLAQRFSILLVCSEDDRRYIRGPRVRVLPNGFQRLTRVDRRPAWPPRIGFIGTFKYWPNVDGVHWFYTKAWPIIRQHLPDCRLRLIGEGSEIAAGWGDGVEPLGRIDDAAVEIATWSVMIVPVRVGAGTRIKIAEAFARECPTVATTLGAYGYGVRHGEELLLSDEPDMFAAQCVKLIQVPQEAKLLAERAYRRFLQNWTWDSYSGIVKDVVKEATDAALIA